MLLSEPLANMSRRAWNIYSFIPRMKNSQDARADRASSGKRRNNRGKFCYLRKFFFVIDNRKTDYGVYSAKRTLSLETQTRFAAAPRQLTAIPIFSIVPWPHRSPVVVFVHGHFSTYRRGFQLHPIRWSMGHGGDESLPKRSPRLHSTYTRWFSLFIFYGARFIPYK